MILPDTAMKSFRVPFCERQFFRAADQIMMNSSFVHLVVAQALMGPYLTVPATSKHTTVSITNGRFTNFFSHFLFTSASLKLNVLDATFRNFQSSAIALSRDVCPSEKGKGWRQYSGNGQDQVTLNGCVFQECHNNQNFDNGDGGAVYSQGYKISIIECGFYDCTASKNAGAIAATKDAAWNWLDKDFNNKENPAGVLITRTCFQQCYVTGTAAHEGGWEEESKLGHVLYTYSWQVGLFDFSALDCSRKGSNRAAVFFARSADFWSERGNMSLSSEVSGGENEDVSAFQVLHVGLQNQADKLPGAWEDFASVNHRFHHTKGFTCKHVYWAHLEQGKSSHVLSNVDVIDTTIVAGNDPREDWTSPAIFYAMHWDTGGEGHQLRLTNVVVYGVTDKTGEGAFAGKNNDAFTIYTIDCATNYPTWVNSGAGIASLESYTPVAFDMENQQYCPLQPTDPPLETTTEEPLEPETDSQTEEPFDSDSPTEEPFETETDSPTEEPVEPDVPSSVDTFSEPDTDPMTSDAEVDPTAETDESNPEAPPSQNSGLPPAAIAGIVIGILLIIAVILILVFLLLRRKKTSSSGSIRDENEMESETTTITSTTETSYPLATTANYNETCINQIFELSDDGEADAFREVPEEAI